MKRVLILKTDDWEACYVDGECIDQAHSLGEGYGKIHFIQEAAREHNFNLDDVVEKYAEEKDDANCCENGSFPKNINDLNYDYLK